MTLVEIIILARALAVVACVVAAQATWATRHTPRRRAGDEPLTLWLQLAGFLFIAASFSIGAVVTATTRGNVYWFHLLTHLGVFALAAVQIRRAGAARAACREARVPCQEVSHG